jgi:hypothetical protein
VVSVFTDSPAFVRTEQSACCSTFQSLTAVLLNIQVLWDVTQCPFVGFFFFFTFREIKGEFSPSGTSSQALQSLQGTWLLSYRHNVTLRKTLVFNFSVLPLAVIRVCPASQRNSRPSAVFTVSCHRIAVFSYNNHWLPWSIC